MALEDKARHTAQTTRGKAKDALGKMTGDEELQAEGKGDQVVGNVKQAGEKVKDAVRSLKDEDR